MIRNIHSKWLYIVLALSAIWTFTYLGQFYQPEPVQQRTAPTVQTVEKVKFKKIDVNEVFKLVNNERTKRGIPALILDDRLVKTAKLKCDDMVEYRYYDHINPETGVNGIDYIKAATDPAKGGGENLNASLKGVTDSKGFVASWMGSKSHRNAILKESNIYTGLAYCKVSNDDVLVQHFGE